jgi:hypothetical protein
MDDSTLCKNVDSSKNVKKLNKPFKNNLQNIELHVFQYILVSAKFNLWIIILTY